jgi:hypothetical protein
MLLDGAEAKHPGLLADSGKIDSGIILFCRENRLAGFEEWKHSFLDVKEEIILNDGEIEVIDQVWDLVGRVLDADRQPARMRLVRQP